MKKIIFIFCLISSSLFSKELTINLEKAVNLALENNGTNRISELNLQLAKAQYEQALSANYPSLDAILYAARDKEDGLFQQRGVFHFSPEFSKTFALANTLGMSPSQIPAQYQAMGITTVEQYQSAIANAPSSMFPPGAISANIDSKSKGRDTVRGELQLNYPIYTGGKISSIIEQARLNKDLQKQAIIRNKAQIIFDVKKYFYGYILTEELYQLVESIYENFEFSRDLTKDFLENGTELKINRTDYLNIKLLTSLTQSTLETIRLNREMLKGALANTIGLKYNDILKVDYDEQEVLKQNRTLQELVEKASTLNPDINSINIALKIKDQQVKESNSAYHPMVNLFGNVSHTYNSYEYGYLNEDQQNRWTIGLALKFSLFDGSRTKNKVLERRLDKKIVDEQKLLLEEGLALQIKNEFIKSSIGYNQVKILKDAVKTAKENSRMNFKGYQYEMVEAEALVQSQLMEVYVKAGYLKSVHDYLVSLATIDKLIGEKVDDSF